MTKLRTPEEIYQCLRSNSGSGPDGKILVAFDAFIEALAALLVAASDRDRIINSNVSDEPFGCVVMKKKLGDDLKEAAEKLLGERSDILKAIVLLLWPKTSEPLMGEVLGSLPAEVFKLKEDSAEFHRLLAHPELAAPPLDERVRLIAAMRKIIEITDSSSTENEAAKACRSVAIKALISDRKIQPRGPDVAPEVKPCLIDRDSVQQMLSQADKAVYMVLSRGSDSREVCSYAHHAAKLIWAIQEELGFETGCGCLRPSSIDDAREALMRAEKYAAMSLEATHPGQDAHGGLLTVIDQLKIIGGALWIKPATASQK